ncbi:hypothetical protein G3P61_001727 [Vibrio parahaemolyticus]|nr:hypothetical protein [Vibrio parahaemolyticus]
MALTMFPAPIKAIFLCSICLISIMIFTIYCALWCIMAPLCVNRCFIAVSIKHFRS